MYLVTIYGNIIHQRTRKLWSKQPQNNAARHLTQLRGKIGNWFGKINYLSKTE